jgi:indole-3-glycerol phosphate synthase
MQYKGVLKTNSVLDDFVEVNKRLIASAKQSVSTQQLQVQCLRITPRTSLLKNLQSKKSKGEMLLIAEIKKASPALGNINIDIDIPKQAQLYEESGASCISVLTQPHKFAGSLADLKLISSFAKLPLLRKDFIFDTYQILEAKANGASAILLIVALLDDALLNELYYFATEISLDVIVEVHTLDELQRAEKLNPQIIGVNSRNLKTMEINLKDGTGLLSQININCFKIAESGITNNNDVRLAKLAGADGVLVGSAIMQAADPATFIKKLLNVNAN